MSSRLTLAFVAASVAAPAFSQPARPESRAQLQRDVASLMSDLNVANGKIALQEVRLQALESRLDLQTRSATAASLNGAPQAATARTVDARNGIESVGQAPGDGDRAPEVAVLGVEGNVVTRKGQLTAEAEFGYTRADRNRAVFRGIEIVQSVLVGVFDINESRQDVLTGAGALRYGLTDRLEVGIRVPYIYRSDASILAPIAGSTSNGPAATIDSSAKGTGIGDVELSARYQLRSARGGWPFLIANVQGVLATGTSPFAVPRNANGIALRAATGAGFYGISPSLTAILPTDPAVLFGTIGYTWNVGRNVNTLIPPVQINRVKPGDAISVSLGIGIALNPRTAFNLGYAHSWAFGSTTNTRSADAHGNFGPETMMTSRDLQIGRLLFGVTYRATDTASINWSVEVGATRDAPDVRTVLRIPIVLLTGG